MNLAHRARHIHDVLASTNELLTAYADASWKRIDPRTPEVMRAVEANLALREAISEFDRSCTLIKEHIHTGLDQPDPAVVEPTRTADMEPSDLSEITNVSHQRLQPPATSHAEVKESYPASSRAEIAPGADPQQPLQTNAHDANLRTGVITQTPTHPSVDTPDRVRQYKLRNPDIVRRLRQLNEEEPELLASDLTLSILTILNLRTLEEIRTIDIADASACYGVGQKMLLQLINLQNYLELKHETIEPCPNDDTGFSVFATRLPRPIRDHLSSSITTFRDLREWWARYNLITNEDNYNPQHLLELNTFIREARTSDSQLIQQAHYENAYTVQQLAEMYLSRLAAEGNNEIKAGIEQSIHLGHFDAQDHVGPLIQDRLCADRESWGRSARALLQPTRAKVDDKEGFLPWEDAKHSLGSDAEPWHLSLASYLGTSAGEKLLRYDKDHMIVTTYTETELHDLGQQVYQRAQELAPCTEEEMREVFDSSELNLTRNQMKRSSTLWLKNLQQYNPPHLLPNDNGNQQPILISEALNEIAAAQDQPFDRASTIKTLTRKTGCSKSTASHAIQDAARKLRILPAGDGLYYSVNRIFRSPDEMEVFRDNTWYQIRDSRLLSPSLLTSRITAPNQLIKWNGVAYWAVMRTHTKARSFCPGRLIWNVDLGDNVWDALLKTICNTTPVMNASTLRTTLVNTCQYDLESSNYLARRLLSVGLEHDKLLSIGHGWYMRSGLTDEDAITAIGTVQTLLNEIAENEHFVRTSVARDLLNSVRRNRKLYRV